MTRPGKQRLTTPHHIGTLLVRAQREAARAAGVGPIDRETWRRVVGDRVANRTVVDRLQSGVLEVRVASSVWAQELSLLASDIMARLREQKVRVRRIRFRVGTVPELSSNSERLEPPPPPVPLPESLRARLAELDDPELAQSIATAAAYSLGREARRRTEPAAIPTRKRRSRND